MKSLPQVRTTVPYDDLPMPVIQYTISSGDIFYANPAAKRLLEFPKRSSKAITIQTLRGKDPITFKKTKNGFNVNANVIHTTLKGNKLVLKVSRKRLGANSEGANLEFLEEVSESTSIKDNIIQTSIDAFISIDESEKIRDWNLAAERIFGWTKKDVLGKALRGTIIPKRLRGAHKAGMGSYLRTGKASMLNRLVETYAVHKDGREFPIELTVTPVMQNGMRFFYSFIRDISDRKAIEDKLRIQEYNLKKAQEIAAVGSWQIAGDSNEIYWSDEFFKIHGLDPQMVKPSTKLRLSMVHPDDRKKMQMAIENAATHGKPYAIEKRIVRPDGSLRWVLSQGEATVDLQTGRKRVLGTLLDITERKSIEEKQRRVNKSLADFQNAIQSSSIVSRADRTGTITYVNDNFVKVSGYSCAELIGNNHRIINSGYHPKSFWVSMWKTISSGKNWRGDVKNKAKDGSFYWVDTFIMPFVNVSGKVEEFLSIRNDITQRKEQEESIQHLNKSLANFQYAIQNSSIVSRTDKRGVITYVNKKFIDISGFDSKELIGQTHNIINSAYHPRSFWTDMWKTISSGRTWRAEVKNKAKNGEYYWVDTFVMPFLDEKKNIKEFLSIRNDITLRKQSEEELAKSNARLSETLVFGKMGSAELNLSSYNLTVSIELLKLLDIVSESPRQVALQDFLIKYVHPDYLARVYSKISEGTTTKIEADTIVEVEFDMVTESGRRISIEAKGIFNGNTALGILHDVTDKNRTSQELIAKSNTINRMLQGITDGFFATDRNLNFTLVSPVFASTANLEAVEMEGRNMLELFPFMEKSQLTALYRSAIHSGKSMSIEHASIVDPAQIFHVSIYPFSEGLFVYYKDISSSKKAEEALRDSNELFRRLSDNVPGMIYNFYLTPEGKPVFPFVSNGCEQLFGLSAERMVKDPDCFFKMIHPDDAPGIAASIESAFKSNMPWNAEFRVVIDANTVKWVAGASNPYMEKNGANYWYGFMNDVTEERSAAVQIERSEHDLRAVLNASNDASFFLDKNRKIRLANFAAINSIKEIFLKDVVLGEDILDFVPGESKNKFSEYFQDALLGLPTEIEKEIAFSASYKVWIKLNYLPVRDRFDSVIGVSFNAANITDRKIAELALKDSEERFKLLYNNTPAMMQSVDGDGRIIRVNDYWLQKMGYSRSEVLGATATNFITESSTKREQDLYHPLFMKTGSVTNASYDFICRDGKILSTLLSAISMHNLEGVGEKSINVITDVTESKKLQEEVEKLAKIVSRTSNSVIFTDENGRITWVNEGFERITEYKLDEVLGRRPGEFLQGSDTDVETVARMRAGIQARTGFKVELLNYSKSGRVYWIDIETLPVTNDSGEVIGYMAIQSEITSLKNAIREMQRSEQTLQSFMDHAPMVAFAKDLQGRYTFYNRTYRDFMSHLELKPGYTDYDIFDKEFSDLCVERDNHIARTSEVLQFEHDVQDKKFLEYKFPLKDSHDKVFAIGGISIDITEKLEAQRIVAENEENLRNLTDSLPKGVLFKYLVDSTGALKNFIYLSSGAINLYGFSADQIKEDAMLVFSMIDPTYLERMLVVAEKSRKALSTFEFEYPITLPNGVTKWIQTRSKPKRLLNGDTEWGGITLDITELKTTESKLQVVYDELDAVLNASSDSSYFLDPAYRIRVFNKAGETQIRSAFRMQVKRGESILTYTPEELKTDFKINFAKAMTGDPILVERLLVFGTISPRWFQIRYLPVFSKGEIIGVSFTATDIHSRKLAEQELFRNRKYFESLVNSQSSYLIRTNVLGEFTFMNDKFAAVFNGGEIDLSLPVLHTVHDTHQRFFHETIRQCIENPGRVFPITLRQLPVGSDKDYWTEWEFVGLHDEENVVVGIQAVGFDATYRVSYQRELERVNSRLMLATHAAKMGIWEWNLKANEISWDNWYYVVHGLPIDAPQQIETMMQIMFPEDRTAIESQLASLSPAESEFSATFRINRPADNEVRFIKFFGAATFDHAGKIDIITGVSYDITEQQVAIRALGESEERFRTLVRDVNIGILLQGPDNEIRLSNQAALRLLGLPEEELSSILFSPEWDVVHEDGSVFSPEDFPLATAIKSRTAVRNVIMGVFRPTSRDRVWLMVDAIPRLNALGQIENVISTFNDISALKAVEERMNETRERLKVITDNLPSVAIYQYETKPGRRDGVYKYYSSGVERLTGLTSEELLGNPTLFENQIHHDDFVTKEQKINDANQKLTVFEHEYRFKHHGNNTWRWLTTRSQPTRLHDGTVVWNGLIIDRSDQRKAEDELLKSLKEKDILIKEIHHRVKNNLQLISSILYIKMMGITENEMRNFLEDTRQKIRSIALIHERLLQTGSVNQVDASDYLSKLIHDLRTSNSRPDFALDVEEIIDHDNMNLDTAIFCGLIINELFTNAIKHAFKNSVQGLIQISLRSIDGVRVLQFSDNGTSLPDTIVPGETGSFGMKMLEIFVKQLNGDLLIDRTGGTSFKIRFK